MRTSGDRGGCGAVDIQITATTRAKSGSRQERQNHAEDLDVSVLRGQIEVPNCLRDGCKALVGCSVSSPIPMATNVH